jgi:valyl-tRNA synthetase
LHGKLLQHPFQARQIPIICDSVLVDMAFGTGAVKVTPAHDPNDFATGKRHGLPEITIFSDDGKINENGGKFAGMMRFDAREAVVAELEKLVRSSGALFASAVVWSFSCLLCRRGYSVARHRMPCAWASARAHLTLLSRC